MAKLNQSKDVVSYFGPNTNIEGELHANGDLHIDGKLNGSIVCNGDLIIGETGKIKGQIKAKNVYVAGYFQGDIDALELLEVQATGFVEGDVKGARLNVHEGGVYKGKVNMDVVSSQSIYEGSFQVINK